MSNLITTLKEVTTAQRLALTAPTNAVVFDTDLMAWYFWNGSAWVAIGSGSSGAMIQLASVTTSGSQSNVTFTSINQTYNSLKVLFNVAQDSGSLQAIRFTLNGDTGANYYDQEVNAQGPIVGGGQEGPQAIINFSDVPFGTNQSTSGDLTFPFYTNTTFYKNTFCYSSLIASGAGYWESWAGQWVSTAAITSINFGFSGGNFVNGSQMILYGIK